MTPGDTFSVFLLDTGGGSGLASTSLGSLVGGTVVMENSASMFLTHNGVVIHRHALTEAQRISVANSGARVVFHAAVDDRMDDGGVTSDAWFSPIPSVVPLVSKLKLLSHVSDSCVSARRVTWHPPTDPVLPSGTFSGVLRAWIAGFPAAPAVQQATFVL